MFQVLGWEWTLGPNSLLPLCDYRLPWLTQLPTDTTTDWHNYYLKQIQNYKTTKLQKYSLKKKTHEKNTALILSYSLVFFLTCLLSQITTVTNFYWPLIWLSQLPTDTTTDWHNYYLVLDRHSKQKRYRKPDIQYCPHGNYRCCNGLGHVWHNIGLPSSI